MLVNYSELFHLIKSSMTSDDLLKIGLGFGAFIQVIEKKLYKISIKLQKKN